MTNSVTSQKVTCWHAGMLPPSLLFSSQLWSHPSLTNTTKLVIFRMHMTGQLQHHQAPNAITVNSNAPTSLLSTISLLSLSLSPPWSPFCCYLIWPESNRNVLLDQHSLSTPGIPRCHCCNLNDQCTLPWINPPTHLTRQFRFNTLASQTASPSNSSQVLISTIKKGICQTPQTICSGPILWPKLSQPT